MSATPRGPELRAALVRETRALVEEDGLANLNLRALARRVGVSQPALYRHFDSKEALLVEVMAEGWRDLDRQGVAAAGDDAPYERLVRLGTSYVRFASDNPGWFRLTFGRRGAIARLQQAHREIPASQALMLAALARIVPPEHDEFGPSYRALWGLAHGLAFLVIEQVFQLVDSDEARIRAAVGALRSHVAGLESRWGPPGPPVPQGPEALFAALSRGLEAPRP